MTAPTDRNYRKHGKRPVSAETIFCLISVVFRITFCSGFESEMGSL